MRQTRRFQDLTIGDNYMFGSVMMEILKSLEIHM